MAVSTKSEIRINMTPSVAQKHEAAKRCPFDAYHPGPPEQCVDPRVCHRKGRGRVLHLLVLRNKSPWLETPGEGVAGKGGGCRSSNGGANS